MSVALLRRKRAKVAGVICGILLALGIFVSSVSADLIICATGSGAGQCSAPRGVAVDRSNERLYVADAGNSRVDVFEATGGFLTSFGSQGTGAGQFEGMGGIAVDNDPTSPSFHDIYVIDEGNYRVQKFDPSGNFLLMFGKGVNTGTSGKPNLCTNTGAPTNVCGPATKGFGPGQFNGGIRIAVGSGGIIYVADSTLGSAKSQNHVQKFAPTGEPVGPPQELAGAYGDPRGLAVDSSGNIYFSDSGYTEGGARPGGVHKYDPGFTPFGAPYPLDPSSNISALGMDATDDLFVADNSEIGSASTLLEYSSAGTQLGAFVAPESLAGVATALAPFHTAGGDIFLSQTNGVVQLSLPPPGPVTRPGSCTVSEITGSKANFKCEVNPQGKASSYHFEYVDDANFDVSGFSEAEKTPEEPLKGAVDFSLHLAETKLAKGALMTGIEYHVRIVVQNAESAPGGNLGEALSFITKAGPEVLDTWAREVGSDTAVTYAEVNPNNLVTSGRFEYVDDAHFQSEGGFASPSTKTGAETINFGDGEKAVRIATQIAGLSPATTYHYRVRGEFDSGSIPGVIFSEERLLRTFPLAGPSAFCANDKFRSGASAALPDCRAYELVSPLDKANGDILTRINITGYPTSLNQSPETVPTNGLGFTYSSYRAFANPQSAPFTNQYLAVRHERGQAGEGWQSEAIAPPRGVPFRFELENEYNAFSADLSSGWLRQESEPTLDPCVSPGFAGLYRRESATGAFEALSCAGPSQAFKKLSKHPSLNYMPELQGFSVDGSHALIRIDDALTTDASKATVGKGEEERPVYQVYESLGAEELVLVSVLPNGKASDKDSSVGTALISEVANHNRFQIVAGAVSKDGSRVFWSSGSGGVAPIYLRLNATSEPSLDGSCDEAGKACTVPVSGGEPAFFQAATPEGTKALYEVPTGENMSDLYEYDVESEEATLIGEEVQKNILGASEDLSRVYFASTRANAQEQDEGAKIGSPNIYLAEGGTSRFIGTLSSGPASDTASNPYGSPIATSPILRTSRVSANGASLVFMSNSAALAEAAAGYDNTDALSPARCGAKAEDGKEGICDFEVYLYGADAAGGAGKLRCISCDPSGGRPAGRAAGERVTGEAASGPFAATVPLPPTQLYQSRYLSADGNRAFFNSFDALVLGDSNSSKDVYQWEAAGTGDCGVGSGTYVASSEGCLSLVSSGKSPTGSELLDASALGSDVFFTTVEGLLPQDPGLIDVYDARIGGGFPPLPGPIPLCEGEACQSPPEAPNDPTPASAAFEGAGNVVEKPHKKKKKKHVHKQKKRHHNKDRRAAR